MLSGVYLIVKGEAGAYHFFLFRNAGKWFFRISKKGIYHNTLRNILHLSVFRNGLLYTTRANRKNKTSA
jgi:hypothetical protein